MYSNQKRVKTACYLANISMAICSALPSLLFLTFRNIYGISYSLLGTLILIFYFTQLIIDLIFSFLSHRFNIKTAVKIMPIITFLGLIIYAASPLLFAGYVYIGLVIGTVIFAVSAGFAEVLISPVVATLPADDPDREMSKLHSSYAWGCVFVVLFSTVFLLIFGQRMWQLLPLILSVVPAFGAVMFIISDIPNMDTPDRVSGAFGLLKNRSAILCVLAIFIGGAAECSMSQWASSYLEVALGIDKIWGDIFGVALFAIMLGVGRSLYGKFGKNIERILLICIISSVVCYLTASLSPIPVIGLAACALAGLTTSMLWPGSLIVASKRNPDGGVFIYALMAAGGDLGASFAPQLIGIVTDAAMSSDALIDFAANIGIDAEQLGMKIGMLVGMLFPLIGIIVFGKILKTRAKS